MKILMLTDRMDMGGAETHIAQLLRGLQALGCEVALFSGGGRLADELEQEGVTQYRASLPTHAPHCLLHLRRDLHRLVRTEGYAVLHAHSRITAWLIRGCERYGAATMVTVHAHFRTDPVLSRICYWGQYTVAVSEDLRRYVCEAYGVPYERVRVIANGIDMLRFSPTPNEKNEDTPSKKLLFASRLDKDCSLGALLLCALAPALCTRFPDLRITIAGNGNDTARVTNAAERANRLLGFPAVTLVGAVRDMPSLLRGQDIFVGVSRAALEAAATGCAVLLCGNEGYCGVLTEESLPLATLSNFCARGCKKATAHELERDLIRLLDDSNLYRQARLCSHTVRAQFDSTRMCRETLALYHRALPSLSPRVRVTVCGYFGCGNAGDDAILLGLLEELHTAYPSIDVTVLSGSPRRDSRRFGVRCVSRRNPFTILAAILRSDAVLFGGGSLLQNLTSNRSLAYYLALLRLANSLHRPVFFSAAGIGPLIGKKATVRVKKALERCRYVSLRDVDSARLLRKAGMDAAHLHEGADPALLMPFPPYGRGDAILQALSLPADSRLLCVVLKGGSACTDVRKLLLAAVRLVCRRHSSLPLFVILDDRHDAKASETAARATDGYAIRLREPSDACALFEKAEAVVSMRLHALILSCAVGTPAVGIPADVRDSKITAFAKATGQDHIHASELSAAILVERIEAAMTERNVFYPILRDSAAEQRKKARKDLANITKMIYNIKQ